VGILDKIVGKKEKVEESEPLDFVAMCPHTVMLPRWDRAEDIGHPDMATEYVCEACGSIMSPEEAREVEAGQAQRLREITAVGTSEAAPEE